MKKKSKKSKKYDLFVKGKKKRKAEKVNTHSLFLKLDFDDPLPLRRLVSYRRGRRRRRRRRRRRHGDDEKTRVLVLAAVLKLRVFRVLSVGRERAREEEFDQKYEREREEGDGARAVERRGGGRESDTRREREGRDAEILDRGVSMDDEKRVW